MNLTQQRFSCVRAIGQDPAHYAVPPSGFGPRVSMFLAASLLAVPVLAFAGEQPDVRRDATVAAVQEVMPCVVNIATETIIEYHDFYDELLQQFYGTRRPMRQQKSIDLGSGVIIDEEGYVLTNFHVVRRANRVQVKLWDGREYDADRVVATPGSDVALLKLRAKPGEKFKSIKLAADDDLLLGETVLALGNPYGLGAAVTRGILSSKNRRPSSGDEPLQMADWLQTDAAINPGNSGGPLVNLRGELIGLNVAVYREQQGGQRGVGVGFSIPVKQVSAALSRFFAPEVTDSLWLGAQFRPGSNPVAVSSVQAGSPAATAGLQTNDLVLLVNGRAPGRLITCNRLLAESPEQRAELVVKRGDERRTLKLRLIRFEDAIRQKLGLTLLEITPEAARRLGLRGGEALYVDEVEKNGPADRAQLDRGFLVTAIEGQSAADLRSFFEVLSDAKKGGPVRLTVIVPRRLGGSYVELQPGSVDVRVR